MIPWNSGVSYIIKWRQKSKSLHVAPYNQLTRAIHFLISWCGYPLSLDVFVSCLNDQECNLVHQSETLLFLDIDRTQKLKDIMKFAAYLPSMLCGHNCYSTSRYLVWVFGYILDPLSKFLISWERFRSSFQIFDFMSTIQIFVPNFLFYEHDLDPRSRFYISWARFWSFFQIFYFMGTIQIFIPNCLFHEHDSDPYSKFFYSMSTIQILFPNFLFHEHDSDPLSKFLISRARFRSSFQICLFHDYDLLYTWMLVPWSFSCYILWQWQEGNHVPGEEWVLFST